MASDPATGQAAWGYGIAAAGLVIALLSPVLGSIADQTGPRKPWIGFFAVIQILSLSLLWFAAPGSSLFLVVLCFSLASVAAEFSTVFNDSMMPRLVPQSEIGKISNVAWGLGYLGGMVALIFVVTLLAASPETGKTIIGATPLFGLDPKLGEDARATGPLSALWYLVFILPMFFYTPDALKGIPAGSAVREGLKELKATISEVRERGGIFRFLIARMLYQDGVNALLALGGAFAAAMFSWSITEIGIFGIILNVVAVFGCMVAARMDTSLGSKTVVMIALVFLTVATIGIVSTGPGYTLFGAWMMPGEHSGGLFGTPAGKSLCRLRPFDRSRLRPGAGLVALLHGAQRHGGRSGPLFRHLRAGRAGDELRRPLPRRHRHRSQRLAKARHRGDHPVPGRRHVDIGRHALSGGPAEGRISAFSGGSAARR
jgi:UMF1 family MFS transporter